MIYFINLFLIFSSLFSGRLLSYLAQEELKYLDKYIKIARYILVTLIFLIVTFLNFNKIIFPILFIGFLFSYLTKNYDKRETIFFIMLSIAFAFGNEYSLSFMIALGLLLYTYKIKNYFLFLLISFVLGII